MQSRIKTSQAVVPKPPAPRDRSHWLSLLAVLVCMLSASPSQGQPLFSLVSVLEVAAQGPPAGLVEGASEPDGALGVMPRLEVEPETQPGPGEVGLEHGIVPCGLEGGVKKVLALAKSRRCIWSWPLIRRSTQTDASLGSADGVSIEGSTDRGGNARNTAKAPIPAGPARAALASRARRPRLRCRRGSTGRPARRRSRSAIRARAEGYRSSGP